VTDTDISHFATWSVPIDWYTGTRGGNLTGAIYCEAPDGLLSSRYLISPRKEPFSCQYTRQDNLSSLDSRF
jgi:hypothetical protein